jgi:FtsP/CotA-like multicopper oxidase with cupredoxin domain
MAPSTTTARLRSLLAALALALSLASMLDVTAVGAAEVTFVLPIANGRVPENMRLIRVKRGDVVTLKWSSDKAMSLHLHGYDIEKEVAPGAVTEMTFTARATGRFTVEPHVGKQPTGGHAHGDVLVTIEVYP